MEREMDILTSTDKALEMRMEMAGTRPLTIFPGRRWRRRRRQEAEEEEEEAAGEEEEEEEGWGWQRCSTGPTCWP